MVLWKCLFEMTSKDIEALRKKKRALDDLLSSNRISHQTYECISKDLNEAITNAERYLESLISKMKGRIDDLERQIGVLELCLANTEMMYAAGEMDYETYERQSRAIITGIESMRREISEIKGILGAPTPESVSVTKPAETIVTPVEKTVPVAEARSVEETIVQTPFSP